LVIVKNIRKDICSSSVEEEVLGDTLFEIKSNNWFEPIRRPEIYFGVKLSVGRLTAQPNVRVTPLARQKKL
jgi:hypothetical protein